MMIEIHGQRTALVSSVLNNIGHGKAIYRNTSAANVIGKFCINWDQKW